MKRIKIIGSLSYRIEGKCLRRFIVLRYIARRNVPGFLYRQHDGLILINICQKRNFLTDFRIPWVIKQTARAASVANIILPYHIKSHLPLFLPTHQNYCFQLVRYFHSPYILVVARRQSVRYHATLQYLPLFLCSTVYNSISISCFVFSQKYQNPKYYLYFTLRRCHFVTSCLRLLFFIRLIGLHPY